MYGTADQASGRVNGGSLPLDVWLGFMREATADFEPATFPEPPDEIGEMHYGPQAESPSPTPPPTSEPPDTPDEPTTEAPTTPEPDPTTTAPTDPPSATCGGALDPCEGDPEGGTGEGDPGGGGDPAGGTTGDPGGTSPSTTPT